MYVSLLDEDLTSLETELFNLILTNRFASFKLFNLSNPKEILQVKLKVSKHHPAFSVYVSVFGSTWVFPSKALRYHEGLLI